MQLIRDKLLQHVERLARELLPSGQKRGREWVCGSIHGEAGGSLSLCLAGAKAGVWSDFATGDGGDLIALIARKFNLRPIDAMRWAADWLHLGTMDPRDRDRAEREAREEAARRERDAQADEAQRIRKAKGLYLAGLPIDGTPADLYLRARGIDLEGLPRVPRSLRYRSEVFCREAGRPLPAMLAPMVDGENGGQRAVHRTWLDRDRAGVWRKASLDTPKKAWGPMSGCVIPLTRGVSDKPLREAPAGEWIAMAEGIENALSCAILRHDWRCVAAGSLNNLGVVRLPPRIGGIYLIADNDASPATRAAFSAQVAALQRRGWMVSVIRPPAGIKDFNDWLRALAPQTGVTP